MLNSISRTVLVCIVMIMLFIWIYAHTIWSKPATIVMDDGQTITGPYIFDFYGNLHVRADGHEILFPKNRGFRIVFTPKKN